MSWSDMYQVVEQGALKMSRAVRRIREHLTFAWGMITYDLKPSSVAARKYHRMPLGCAPFGLVFLGGKLCLVSSL